MDLVQKANPLAMRLRPRPRREPGLGILLTPSASRRGLGPPHKAQCCWTRKKNGGAVSRGDRKRPPFLQKVLAEQEEAKAAVGPWPGARQVPRGPTSSVGGETASNCAEWQVEEAASTRGSWRAGDSWALGPSLPQRPPPVSAVGAGSLRGAPTPGVTGQAGDCGVLPGEQPSIPCFPQLSRQARAAAS